MLWARRYKNKIMQQTIWKFPLEVTDKQFINLPKGAEVLAVQTQNEEPCLWALVNPNEPKEERCFETFGTGHPVPVGMGVDRKYISTYQLSGGSLVFHVFERW